VLLLGPDQRDDFLLYLRIGESFAPIIGFLIEGRDRRKPIIFTRVVKISGVLAQSANSLGEL
jgi:hypothetical protein